MDITSQISRNDISKGIKDVITKTKRLADTVSEQANKKRGILNNITNATVCTRLRTRSAKSSAPAQNQKTLKKTAASCSDVLPKFTPLQKKQNISDTIGNLNKNREDWDTTGTFFEGRIDRYKLNYSSAEVSSEVPQSMVDFDEENAKDPNSESHHAKYIFYYYRRREAYCIVRKYLDKQPDITSTMRAVLVDWMVEVQENFELNHETLYLAVRLVDMYLMHRPTSKRNLQLVAATAILIASKYDERMPPLVDDFLYICDDCYKKHELLAMEIRMLTAVKFDLGVPLSYRFLRRIARGCQLSMEMLTLARFILETSLMEYDLIEVSGSKMAAASMYLALKMKNMKEWTVPLAHYSGYKAEELEDLVMKLNRLIAKPPHPNLTNIRIKYSHEIFFHVAKVPPLPLED